MPQVTLSPATLGSATNYAVGSISRTGNGNWTSTRSGTMAGVASQTGTTVKRVGVGFTGGGRGSYLLHRSFIWYDLSSLIGTTITAAVLSVPTLPALSPTNFDVIAVESSAFSNNTSTTLNQSQFTNTNFNNYSGPTTWNQGGGQQQIIFSGQGISALNASTTAPSTFGVAIIDNAYDNNNVNPGGGLGFDAYYYADLSTTTARSRWTIDITFSSSGWSGGEMNGVDLHLFGSVVYHAMVRKIGSY